MLKNPLQQEIESREITKEETAEKLGVGVSTLYSWLSGDRFPNTSNFREIAKFVGMKQSDLLQKWQKWREQKLEAERDWKRWQKENGIN
jgi:transcriptional regulator with XRE-family HTH domain